MSEVCVVVRVVAHPAAVRSSSGSSTGRFFRRGGFIGFFLGFAVEVFAEPFDFAGEFVDFAEQFLLGDQPVGLFPAQGDVLLQYVVVLFAQQVDRALHVGQHVVAALAAADQPGDGSGQEAARQGIGQQVGDKCRVHFGSSCRMGLENAGFPEPCLHVERRAGFGCQFVMSYDGCAGKPGDEIPDVVFEGAFLLRSAGVAGGRAVGGDSSGVCDVTAGGVVTTGAVGDLPGIDRAVFVVGDEPFDAAVQVDEVGITHLTPASTALGNGGCVPPADIGGTHFAAGRRGRAVDDESFEFCHNKKVWKGLESGRRPDSDGVDKLRPRVWEKVGRFGLGRRSAGLRGGMPVSAFPGKAGRGRWMPAKITDAVPEYKSEGHPAAFRWHDVGLFRCDAADFRFFGLSLKRFDGSGYETSAMHVCCSI